MPDPAAVADEVLSLLQSGDGRGYIGEPVSQLAHALQGAALAARAGADDTLVLATLLHDIGHQCEGTPQMAGLGTLHHERHGAEFLRQRGFSQDVAALVGGHVDAKRYLVARTPGYFDRLSDASRQTLLWQGGAMGIEEAKHFCADRLFADKLRLRAWDEAAKDPAADVPSLQSYRLMMIRHLQAASAPSAAMLATPEAAPSATGAGRTVS
jgi:putative nucleotidyltransferase with HDIG domain